MAKDLATEYAEDVAEGRIVANRHVINACRRHLDDIERRHGKDLLWMPERANDIRTFFKDHCTITDPKLECKSPLELMPWQEFVIGSLFGWIIKEDKITKRKPGTRRFRKLFLTSAKTTGKSGMVSGLDLYLIIRDHYIDLDGKVHWIESPYVMVSASTQSQAIKVGLRVSAEMVKNSEELQSGCIVLGGNTPFAICCQSSNGRLEAVTNRSGVAGTGGLLIHAVHMEETSEDNNRERWEALMAGLKMSPQPLVMIATNPPPMMSGIAYDEYKQAIEASSGNPEYDHVLGLIYAMDDEEIPESVVNVEQWYPAEKNWEKANPSIRYGLPRESYLHQQIKDATTTAKKRKVLRLNFGAWQDEHNDFVERDQVIACEVDKINEGRMKKKPLWVGLDLATTDDLTAIAMLWGDEKKQWLKVEAYTGLANIHERTQESSGDMESWVEEGYIKGNKSRTLDFRIVAKRIHQLYLDHNLQAVALDTHRRGDWDRVMDDLNIPYRYETESGWGAEEGILFVPHPQGYASSQTGLLMDTSMDAIERAIYEQTVSIERTPVFQWAIESVRVRTNERNERKIVKQAAQNACRGKIDVLIAALQAFGLMRRGLLEPDMGKKGYNPWLDPDFDINDLVK